MWNYDYIADAFHQYGPLIFLGIFIITASSVVLCAVLYSMFALGLTTLLETVHPIAQSPTAPKKKVPVDAVDSTNDKDPNEEDRLSLLPSADDPTIIRERVNHSTYLVPLPIGAGQLCLSTVTSDGRSITPLVRIKLTSPDVRTLTCPSCADKIHGALAGAVNKSVMSRLLDVIFHAVADEDEIQPFVLDGLIKPKPKFTKAPPTEEPQVPNETYSAVLTN